MSTTRGTGPRGARSHRILLGTLLTTLWTLTPTLALHGQVTSRAFRTMEARNIGPAGMSGRVAAVDVDPSDSNIIFVGAATGGVWRSQDGGLQWSPVFDDQPLQGIGSVAVFEANPSIVWVGTGEGNPRNSAGVGAGIFKSLDGGTTWRRMGLARSERIHRVVLHPSDPDLVYAGAMGPAWSEGQQRGVFRSRDGGESWEQILYVNPRTGVADLVMDPQNPNKLIAALWEFRRQPWFFESGGPGSGLFITYDGGDTWRRLTAEDGLPEGTLGRIGLAFAPSNPRIVYALVEATRNVLLRSDDGGGSWTRVSDQEGINPRPFYYADIRVDPANENRIYRLASSIDVSEDGGRSFRNVVPSRIIHGDVHELWIDPGDSRRMIMGNDGGIAFTFDRGRSWRFVENLPLAQFYHISVDMDRPFNVYGGLQDNGSWFGPSRVWEDMGIMNAHWRRTGGGDGFASIPDYSDPRYGYSMSQQGNLMRFDRDTGERRDIQPVHPEGVELRFNWNAALNVDPHDSTTIYLGSQFVHRSRDGGLSWEIISPDLTTNDPEKQRQDVSGGLTLDATGAENHTTILSIAPSPVREGLIWVSTDDGRVQLTRDAGESWNSLEDRIPEVPPGTYAPHVEPSKHDAERAYVVFDDHRRGNWTTYVFRTDNLGETWSSLNVEGVQGFAHVLEEDPEEPNLLFLGTEFGLHVSLDGGQSWIPWTHGLPRAPVRALVVHPRDHDLVVGTHGRAVYILDDIRPLRALARDGVPGSGEVRVFEPAPAYQVTIAERIGYRSYGHAMFFGENPPYGALVTFWADPANDVESAWIRILSEDGGEEVAELSRPVEAGMNRFAWDLRQTGDDGSQRGGRGGAPLVLPGSYRVEVTVGETSAWTSLEVRPDPRRSVSMEDRRANLRALEEVMGWTAVAAEGEERLESALAATESVLETLESASDPALREEATALRSELRQALERLYTGPSCQGICGGDPLVDTVRRPLSILGSSVRAPSPNARVAMRLAREALSELVADVNRILDERVNPFQARLQAAGFTPFPSLEPIGGTTDEPGDLR